MEGEKMRAWDKFYEAVLFMKLKEDMTRIETTVNQMSDVEVSDMVEKIISMYDRIARQAGPLD
ncbi:MAG: hypothetical protein JRJ79_18380 [Deltaproteobacteria bacterium]|nr:hypothetical protein [Deltaproteobacteria bacterium]